MKGECYLRTTKEKCTQICIVNKPDTRRVRIFAAFEQAYRQAFPDTKTKAGQKRERKSGAGRKGVLTSIEQKLLFSLVYQRSYPVQSIMGELFGISQSQANEWIHTLLPILKQALDDLGYKPERDPKKFKKSEQGQKDAAESIIDGTERRRQRPKDAKKQAMYYSGKKKIHSEEECRDYYRQEKTSFLSEPNIPRQNSR